MTTPSASPLFTTLDLNADGKHYGFIQAPQSTNTAGWANMFIPLVTIKNGSGPNGAVLRRQPRR